MKDLTILEAARELGYSKNAVKYQVTKLPGELVYKDEKQITRLKPAAIEELRRIMGNKQPAKNQQTTTKETEPQPTNNHETTTQENALYTALLQTVESLQKQLETKDRQIETLTTALLNAQQAEQQAHLLHAGTMQAEAGRLEIRSATPAPEEPAEPKKRGWKFWRK